MADYVYLKNISGTLIKPVTDLAAINMTYTNGVEVNKVNGGTIGIVDGYIESSYYENMIDTEVGPARPESSYISGGTMYTLLGGYTISQDVPGQNPSPYKVPSEQAVRAAIDAYVATGGSDIVPGKAINVTGGSINVTTADVEDLLDETTPIDTKAVTPEALLGALSVGQAVDVSCAPYTNTGTITYGAGGFLDGFTVTMVSGTTVGFYDTGSHSFPKFAKDGNDNPLHYIFIADVSGTGTITPNGYDAITLSNTPQRISTEVTAEDTGWFSAAAAATVNVANWRQYEVTALTAEAKEYIASAETNPDPDALFRSSNAYSILNKYLIKQDMVSPFVPIINMDNKDVTIGAGLAYSVKLTDGQNHDFTVDTIPSNGYGWDSHLQLFIAGTAGATFVPPLALMDPLTPNAGHNITIKWRAGQALAYVDDTDIGYVVSIASGTENGTLYYGLKNETGEYVVFAGALDGQVIEVTGDDAFVTRNTRLIGNGTENTIISGILGAATNNTLNLQGLSVSGSTFSGSGTTTLSYDTAVSDSELVSGTITFDNGATIIAGSTFTNMSAYIDVQFYDAIIAGTYFSPVGHVFRAARTYKINGNNTGKLIVESYGFGGNGAANTIDIRNIDVTGCTSGGEGLFFSSRYTHWKFTNVKIYGNTAGNQTVNCARYNTSAASSDPPVIAEFDNCLFKDNSNKAINLGPFSTVSITGCTFGLGQDIRASVVDETIGPRNSLYIAGNNILQSAIFLYTSGTDKAFLNVFVAPNTTLDLTNSTARNNVAVEATRIFGGDNFTVITADGSNTIVFDAITYDTLTVDGKISIASGNMVITGSAVDPWKAANAIFASPLDAHKAYTVKLSGTTFTSASKIENTPMCIQITPGTISFSDNTNDENTKILQAPVMLVCNDPTAPSGNATVITATGTTTFSGIGTYIDKEGDNDFVAIENVTAVVNGNTSGTGSLDAALTAGKWSKINDEVVANAAYDDRVDFRDKMLLDHSYNMILGGTFSVMSNEVTVEDTTTTYYPTMSVDEANKVVSVTGGCLYLGDTYVGAGWTYRMDSTEDILYQYNIAPWKGSGTLGIRGLDTVLDFNGHPGWADRSVIISGLTCSNANKNVVGGNNALTRGAVAYESSSNTVTATDCLFVNNYAIEFGGAFMLQNQSSTAVNTFTRCVFSNNTNGTANPPNRVAINMAGQSFVYLIDCTFLDTQSVVFGAGTTGLTEVVLQGHNKLGGFFTDNIGSTTSTNAYIILDDNSVLDFSDTERADTDYMLKSSPNNPPSGYYRQIQAKQNVTIIDKHGGKHYLSGVTAIGEIDADGTIKQRPNSNITAGESTGDWAPTFGCSYRNCVLARTVSGRCMLTSSDHLRTMNIENCTIKSTISSINIGGSGGASGILNMSGDNSFEQNITCTSASGYYIGTVNIADNTIIRLPTTTSTSFIYRVGTIVVGTGCKIYNGTTAKTIPAGTYYRASLDKTTGLITEDPET